MTRAEQRERTKAALVRTASTAFAREGYAATSVSAVVAAASVTKGAFYHHFTSKEALFDEVVRDLQREVAEEVASCAERGGGSTWDGLLAGCRAFVAAATDDRRRRVLLVDGPAVIGLARWRQLDDEGPGRLLREGLEELRAAGTLPAGPVEPLARLLSGAMNEAALWACDDDRDRRLAQVDVALSHLLDCLRR